MRDTEAPRTGAADMTEPHPMTVKIAHLLLMVVWGLVLPMATFAAVTHPDPIGQYLGAACALSAVSLGYLDAVEEAF